MKHSQASPVKRTDTTPGKQIMQIPKENITFPSPKQKKEKEEKKKTQSLSPNKKNKKKQS